MSCCQTYTELHLISAQGTISAEIFWNQLLSDQHTEQLTWAEAQTHSQTLDK